ncbi:hypothetical protein PaG_00335 [Moesziomyces aphidis]|uniref:Pentatricopeptide repeat protein n=1 Tax=Moesziomyces aphidis TaxID=84754 RepID=W3VWX5_MOEAP|nr:hypothetical protein PaG_00335 [Moesziomyces aphidis]
MACSRKAAGLPRPIYRLARAGGASTAAVVSTPMLPPAFLAPAAFTQAFSTQSPARAVAPRSQSRSQSNGPTVSSAHNLKAVLRRLGKSNKWSETAPDQSLDSPRGRQERESRSVVKHPGGKAREPRSSVKQSGGKHAGAVARSDRPRRSDDGERSTQLGFRLRAKKLLDHLAAADRAIGEAARPGTDVNAALDHFDNEMRALRVMVKSKDVLIDPDNAWKSASRIKAPYNAAIRLCFRAGRVERAIKLVNQMKKDGIFPSASTYTIVIQGLSRMHPRHHLSSAAGDSVENETALQNLTQRAEQAFEELEKLWQQAFPQYFQRGSGAPPFKSILTIDEDSFHKLSDQARRNLVSQQSSVHEAQQFPRLLTNAINSYLNFLRCIGRSQDQIKILDRLFPSALIERLARGLAPDASSQDKLELANRKLSDCLPLGHVSTFTPILILHRDTRDREHQAVFKRIWTLCLQLMEIERQQATMHTPQADPPRRSRSKADAAEVSEAASRTSEFRFRPDDRLVSDFFIRTSNSSEVDAKSNMRLGLSILARVYGLDLESTADGIVRDPQSSSFSDSFGPARYLLSHDDIEQGCDRGFAELKDGRTAGSVLRGLAVAQPWQHFVALFNYLWSRAHSEDHGGSEQRDALLDATADKPVFGDLLQASNALRLLWVLGDAGDPVGARVILRGMKRAAAQQAGPSRRRSGDRRARPSDSSEEEVQDWEPADLSYVRVMRAIMVATQRRPAGLTAAIVKEAAAPEPHADVASHASKPSYDPWTEAKTLLVEFSARKANGGSVRAKSQAAGHEFGTDGRGDTASRRQLEAPERAPEWMARIHLNAMVSFFLNIAHVCAAKHANQGDLIAREALTLLEEKFGLEELVRATRKLQNEMNATVADGEASAKTLPARRLGLLNNLGKVTALALDASNHSFAPKADVETWKGVRKLLSTMSVFEESDARPSAPVGKMRGGLAGNHLLLSKDDYLELEGEADSEEFEKQAFGEGDSQGRYGARGSQRTQRRSRHVEQELQRWVRGASS